MSYCPRGVGNCRACESGEGCRKANEWAARAVEGRRRRRRKRQEKRVRSELRALFPGFPELVSEYMRNDKSGEHLRRILEREGSLAPYFKRLSEFAETHEPHQDMPRGPNGEVAYRRKAAPFTRKRAHR